MHKTQAKYTYLFAHTSLHRAVSSVNAGLIRQEWLHLRIVVNQLEGLSRPHKWFEDFRKFRKAVEFAAKIVNDNGQMWDLFVIILRKECPHRIDADLPPQEAPNCRGQAARKNIDLAVGCILQMVVFFNRHALRRRVIFCKRIAIQNDILSKRLDDNAADLFRKFN